MSDGNVPMDLTAEQAARVVKAAILWRWKQDDTSLLSREEWQLLEAVNAYGDKFKGLRAQ